MRHALTGMLGAVILIAVTAFAAPVAAAPAQSRAWIDQVLAFPYASGSIVGEPAMRGRYPFSFTYGGKTSDELIPAWKQKKTHKRLDARRTQWSVTWTEPAGRLKVHWQAIQYKDFPAAEWLLSFENAGTTDTAIIEDIQALDLNYSAPVDSRQFYKIHTMHGGTPDPVQCEPSVVVVDPRHPLSIGSGAGRSSTAQFPFFKVEGGDRSIIAAVGWSGTWKADFSCLDAGHLRMRAGMEKTHFLLHPDERVRSPRILLLHWAGDTQESNAQWRQLIYKYYAARRRHADPLLPTVFCNTAFTRGGFWLNECNEQNQISLIKAYGALGLEALLTDAGWFTGGWPDGAGNWDPRKDAYPNGMGPVAAAAKAHGMIYGLWFEPERVMKGTQLDKAHPEWVLTNGDPQTRTCLVDFGRREVQDYFFSIVEGFMKLPGFRFYRQDFNMDPISYWRHNDAPDRQGITEIKYIEGLYAYWDRIARAWPDSLREECASGGHRIDLETVMRMHMHQKSDFWFNNEVDQASLWSLSQYLPNNCVVTHLTRFDDDSFRSVAAGSLCLGWIADAPDFDRARGLKIMEQYRAIRHLVTGAWYPLLPCSRDPHAWMASQYHRPDLDEGLILAFRHAQSPQPACALALHALNPAADYRLDFSAGKSRTVGGGELMKGLTIELAQKPASVMIRYKKVRK